jgi:predicted TPR repeat methyltransferase
MTPPTKDDWSATMYDKNANFVPVLGAIILGMLNPQPNETILDLGCGDGVLTKDLQGLCGRVVGVDASPNMIEKAKEFGCKDTHVVDGHALAAWFDNENIEQQIGGKFDAVFSNAGKQPTNIVY